MKDDDLDYLCMNIANLSGIPVRLYCDNQLEFSYSLVELVVDPIVQFEEDLLKIERHIEYYITPIFHYYGVIVFGNKKIIIGPTRQLELDKQNLIELAFLLNVPHERTNDFISSLMAIPVMPLESFTLMLCVINFGLNNEKINPGDVFIFDNIQEDLRKALGKARVNNNFDSTFDDADVHNTFAFEQTMLNFVRKGDVVSIKKLFNEASFGRAGKLSSDFLRQYKNMFVVSATLVSRSAIRGGMIANDAFSLSDAYIQRCELLNDVNSIVNLQYHMVLDYTIRINNLTNGIATSQIVIDIKNYIAKHLSEPIKISDIAKSLFISRSHLSARFKEETGMSLADFIMQEKIEEAKRLLAYTDKSLVAISNYLGFSSQSHFQNIFKNLTEMTPKQFRERRDYKL